MLPIFPQFKKLELSDREDIEVITSQFPPYSDFNFASLWSYNVNDEAEISVLNKNLVIKFHDYITQDPFYTFIGTNSVKETLDVLLDYSSSNQIPHELALIPEVVVNQLNGSRKLFSVVDDINNYDYIYQISALSTLSGKRLRGKRNFVNRFLRQYPEAQVEMLRIDHESAREEMLKLFMDWQTESNKSYEDIVVELKAIKRFFLLNQNDHINVLGIRYKGDLIGFSITEIVNREYAILHFEKCNTTFIGSYQYLKYETAKMLEKNGCMYLNTEQDLGIEGLRKSKQSWCPYTFAKKYKIHYK